MAFLTMEVDGFVGGLKDSGFPPCFSWIYATLRLSSTSCLSRPESPWGAPYLSPRPVPKLLSPRAAGDGR